MKETFLRRFCGVFLLFCVFFSLPILLSSCHSSEGDKTASDAPVPSDTSSEESGDPTVEDAPLYDSLPTYGGALDLVLPEGADVSGLLIAIDAGHGQRDPGNISEGVKESEINLALALRLGRMLEEMGYRVLYLRTDDSALLGSNPDYDTDDEADARREKALAEGADLYLSIHCNADSSGTARGTRIFFHNRISVNFSGRALSDKYADALNKVFAPRIESGEAVAVKDIYLNGMTDPYIVLKDKNMPALLFEVGFMTNESDLSLLTNSDYLYEYAYAMAIGTHSAHEAKLFGTK